nr:hypothetical protein [Tanacetum cinerariifolium]
LQHASTSGTQLDKASVYDTDGSAEVQLNDNCYDNDIFIMFTQEEQYTDLLEPIHEPQLVPQNDNYVTSVAISMVQSGGTVETSSAPNEETQEKKKLKHDLKTREDKYLDKEVDLEAKIKDLKNILLKRDQTVQTKHMLNPKPDLFYHPDQKMALGYPNPLYLKQAQLKQKSLYNGNMMLEEHDLLAVYDSEETLKLAQESREKMRFLKKEIKPTNYAKINHLSGVFVPQTTKSKEELFLSNVSNMVTVSKTISIPNEDLSDYTTPSVARKFLNEEADESLDKQKSLELEMERLLKASVSHDIMSIVQNGFVDVPSDLQTELDRTKEKLEYCIIKEEKEYAVLWNNWYTKWLVDTTRTRRPQSKGNIRNAKVPSASKSSEAKKIVTVEDHRRILSLSKNQKTMSSERNNIKLAIRNDKFEIIRGTCKQCFVTANHDACLLSFVNALNSRANNVCANVPPSANQKRPRTQVWKPKQVRFKERLAWTPKLRLLRFSLKWSLSGHSFDLKGKLVASKKINFPNDDKACPSNPQEPIR